MLFYDSYKSIRNASGGSFNDRGSKFLAYLYPIRSEMEVKEIVNALRKEHPKANHHCWAFRLSPDRSVFRVNDDGEPSGTAGRPILNMLLSSDITNVLAIVVRYFGGTLLGVPGLINAYKKAVNDAISNSEIVELSISSLYEITFDHSQMNESMKIIKEEGLKIKGQIFDSICTIELEIRLSVQERILDRFKKIEGLNVKYISTE
jgi:uncharacterized YigZ family protein